MPLDPNIILGIQPVQLNNPLDMAVKAMTLKQLAQQSQVTGQKIADDKAERAAFANNVTTNPSGVPTLNQNAVLSSLYKVNPEKAITLGQTFRQNQVANEDVQKKQARDLIWSANDEPSYQVARQKAIQLGLPNAEMWPPNYDQSLMNKMKLHAMTPEEQMAQQNKDTGFGLKREEIAAKRAETATNKNYKAYESTHSALEAMRGQTAVQQAEKDIYAANKADTLANLYGDPNKLSPQLTNVLVSEIGKIAQNGVPNVHELEGLTPGTLKGALAKEWSKLSNNPTPANAGAFIKQYQDYANGLKKDAQKVIEDRYGRVLEPNKKYLSTDDYDNLKSQYLDRFKNADTPTTKVWNGVTYKQVGDQWVPQ